MGGNRRSNKARNQTTGTHRGVDDAPWFVGQRTRNRKRSKMAKASRRRNRAEK